MTEEEQCLFTLANTAALVLFNQHGNPPTLALSQKVLAEQGANLLGAYKATVVVPAIEAIGFKGLIWQPGATAPKDGQAFWAFLFQSGVRLMEWRTAEENAAEDDGDPEKYEACFVEVHDPDESWDPMWWLPYDAFPEPKQ